MINEKDAMGFTEYLNAQYLKKFGNKEVKNFYKQQANSLEKALEIEDNPFIKNLVSWIDSPDNFKHQWYCDENGKSYGRRDMDFIAYIFSERMRILKFIDNDPLTYTFPGLSVSKKNASEFLSLHKNSKINLEKEIEFIDKYVWDKLTKGKRWVNFNLDELRDYGYPDRNEMDILAENF